MNLSKLFLSLLCAVTLVACGTEDEPAATADPIGLDPTFASINGELLAKTCAFSGCHAGSAPRAGLKLDGTPDENYQEVLAKSTQAKTLSLVEPGNPDKSWLYMKIAGTHTYGQRMPQGSPLHADDVAAVRKWIADGAKQN